MTAEIVDYLSIEDLLEIAAGVMDEVVVRDAGLLAAAAARPQVTVFGEDAYPTFEDKAAALLHSVVRNHALVDGNKRLAWSAARVFCLLNGRDLTYTVDEAEALVVSAAAGRLDVPQIAAWLAARSRDDVALMVISAPASSSGASRSRTARTTDPSVSGQCGPVTVSVQGAEPEVV